MAAAVEELRENYLGSFVDRVSQPDELNVVLAFSGRGPRRHWLFCSDARWPRSHETRVRRANPASPPAFCMLLRKYLDGARLHAVEQPRFDRILHLQFRRGEESITLIQEVMGRHSNLILVGEQGIILGAVKPVPPSQTRVRPILSGLPYQLPPGDRPDPRDLDLAELTALFERESVDRPEAITRLLSGWGTFPSREALAEAGPQAQPSSVAQAVFDRMQRVRNRQFDPTVFHNEQGRPKGLWAFPSRQEGWQRGQPFPSISAACDAYFTELERTFAGETLRKEIAGALQRALRTAELQQAEAQGFLDGMDETDRCRIRGELLTAHAGQVERGATSVELPNWYDPGGGTLVIGLDPELSTRENAERYFRRYRRGMAGAEAALERIPELDARVSELRSTLERAVHTAPEELPALREALRAEGLFREVSAAPSTAGGKPQPELPAGVRIKRAQIDGWEVCWGENATSNDYLTTRLSRPHDLWLHARAITGTHVVIRDVRSLDRLPPAVLREAARLAAAHSEAKHSSVVAVDYTFRRFVRKPRGSAPGAVVYTGEKTLHVDPRTGE